MNEAKLCIFRIVFEILYRLEHEQKFKKLYTILCQNDYQHAPLNLHKLVTSPPWLPPSGEEGKFVWSQEKIRDKSLKNTRMANKNGTMITVVV